MIDVVNFTCAICGAVCDVVQETGEVKSKPCGHEGVIHANLRGRLFGAGAIAHGMLIDDEIPAAHKDRFSEHMADRAVVDGGARKWWVRDWIEYIELYHAGKLPPKAAFMEANLTGTSSMNG